MNKDKNTFLILTFFLGAFGAQWFYVGKTGKAVIYFLFLWTGIPSILALITLVRVAFMNQTEFETYVGK